MPVPQIIKGITFCTLWYLSILFGFLTLYFPLFPLILINNHWYRVLTDKIFSFWELYPTALLQLFFGTKIYVHGDYVDTNETSLLVMNHRTRVDWNYVWLCMFHATRYNKHPVNKDSFSHDRYDVISNGGFVYQNGVCSGASKKLCNGKAKNRDKQNEEWSLLKAFNQKTRLKYVLKDEIRHIPGPGWVMQSNCFIYIKRCWESDKSEILRVVQYLDQLDYNYQLLIFPEGTDLTENNIKKSDSFAKKNNFPTYRQVLHPRTRGFCHLVKAMSPRLAAVYDVTIAYGGCDGCQIRDLIRGNFPPEVHFTIKRYSASSLSKDDILLEQWLNERWRSKEEQLKDFHKHGRFVDASNRLEYQHRADLILALFFWTLLVILYPLSLYFFHMARLITIFTCSFFILIGIFCGGFHHLEMDCFQVKQITKQLFSFNDKKE